MTAAFLCCRSGARPGSVMASLCRCFGPTAKAKWAGTGGGALPWPAVSRGAEPERPRESSLSEQRRVSRDRADRRVPEGEPTARSGVAPTGRANACVPGPRIRLGADGGLPVNAGKRGLSGASVLESLPRWALPSHCHCRGGQGLNPE